MENAPVVEPREERKFERELSELFKAVDRWAQHKTK